MTLVLISDGKVVVRDGKIGTHPDCCCETCGPYRVSISFGWEFERTDENQEYPERVCVPTSIDYLMNCANTLAQDAADWFRANGYTNVAVTCTDQPVLFDDTFCKEWGPYYCTATACCDFPPYEDDAGTECPACFVSQSDCVFVPGYGATVVQGGQLFFTILGPDNVEVQIVPQDFPDRVFYLAPCGYGYESAFP